MKSPGRLMNWLRGALRPANYVMFMIALMCGFHANAIKLAEPKIPTIQTPKQPQEPKATAPAPATFAQMAPSNYVLAPGDAVAIEVYGEPDLSREYTVGEGGRVSFPLIGEVKVAGLKTRELERALVKRLKEGYLVNPRVTVAIRTYRAVYINGQVKSPGSYAYVPGMTVRKMITIAGGFTERASKSRIYVISESAVSEAKPKKVKLDAEVKPGDIVNVEESFF